LVAGFEAGLRVQKKQKGRKGHKRLPLSIPGKQTITGVCTKGKIQKRRQGRPRKLV
jgi:hypothetical protein